MRWPWTRRETRAEGPYTDAIVRLIAQQATGTSSVRAADTGAYETAAGLWERAFESANIREGGPAADAITPAVLAHIGRQLIAAGESLHILRVTTAGPALIPAYTWDIGGSPDAWTYEVTLPGPDTTDTVHLPAEGVVHCRYASDPAEPWRGISPLAGDTAQLAAMLERRLLDEASLPTAMLLPIPPSADRAALAADLKAGGSKLAIVDAIAGSAWGGSTPGVNTGAAGWSSVRIGADPPASLIALRAAVSSSLLAACGVPIELLERTDGAGRREAWRQFLHGAVSPVGRRVAAELAVKLEAPDLYLDFESLFASDLSGRARAFQSMVGAGMEPDKAAMLAGLMQPE